MLTLVDLPITVKNEMHWWRLGYDINFPQSYIDFHENLARRELIRLEKEGKIFVSGIPKLVNSGWFDGMMLLNVQVWDCQLRQMVMYVWQDDNQEFFIKLKKGGSSPARLCWITG